jgi:hypothetical protein
VVAVRHRHHRNPNIETRWCPKCKTDTLGHSCSWCDSKTQPLDDEPTVKEQHRRARAFSTLRSGGVDRDLALKLVTEVVAA